MVKDGATTGKVALVREDFPHPAAVVNEHVFVCRWADGVDPSFLFWFLYSEEGQNRILANFRGSAQGGINQSLANSLVITRVGSDLTASLGFTYNALLKNFGFTIEVLPNVVSLNRNSPAGLLSRAPIH